QQGFPKREADAAMLAASLARAKAGCRRKKALGEGKRSGGRIGANSGGAPPFQGSVPPGDSDFPLRTFREITEMSCNPERKPARRRRRKSGSFQLSVAEGRRR